MEPGIGFRNEKTTKQTTKSENMKPKALHSAVWIAALISSLALTAMAQEDKHDGDVNDPCLGNASKAMLDKVLPTMRAFSVAVSARAMPIASPAARRSGPPAASR